MNRYTAARSILNLVALMGWLVLALSALATLGAWSERGWETALMLGIPALVAGVILLAVAQLAAALLDTAENSFQTVALLEKLAARASAAPAVATPFAAAPSGLTERPAALIKTHHGRAIWREAEGVSVDGQRFPGLLAAERWIEDQPDADPAAP